MTRSTAPTRLPDVRLSRRRILRTGGLAAGFSAVLASLPSGGAVAQEPERKRSMQEGQEEQIAGVVQFIHPDKTLNYGHLPGFEDASATAALYGLDAESYRSIKARFEANARRAAQQLLADPTIAGLVDRIPFPPGGTVLGIGESDMDDLQSWFEILRHLLDLRRPQDQIRVINMGISGQTTTQGLGLAGLFSRQPDLIICGFGGNDSVQIQRGLQPGQTTVSLDESARNLAALRDLAARQTEARWLWRGMWAVDEARIAAYPPFQQGQFELRNADLTAFNEVLRRQRDPVVDSGAALGRPAPSELLNPDGVHPSLAGHTLIARAFVEQLAA
jgi:lysophospholipase L1-like esterase